MASWKSNYRGSIPSLSTVPGINLTLVKALADSRVTHVHHLLAWPEAELARTTGLKKCALSSAYRAVHACFGARKESGDEILSQKLDDKQLFSQLPPKLRCASPFEMCHGHAGDVVEICGRSGSGKTQMCLTVAAVVAAAGRGVVLLDSGGSMDVERIGDILQASGVGMPDIEKALDLITVVPVGSPEAADVALGFLIKDLLSTAAVCPRETELYPHEDFETVARKAESHCLNNILEKLAVVVFDSPAAILSPVLGWRLPDGWTGHAFSSSLAGQLRTIASISKAVVLVTNRLVGGAHDGERRSALGRSWVHFADVRVFLEESDANLIDSSCPRITMRISSRRSGAVSPTILNLCPEGLVPAQTERL